MRRLAFWCVVLSFFAAAAFGAWRLTTNAEPVGQSPLAHSNGLNPKPAPPPPPSLIGPGPAIGGTTVHKTHARAASFALRGASTDVGPESAESRPLPRRAPVILSVPLRI